MLDRPKMTHEERCACARQAKAERIAAMTPEQREAYYAMVGAKMAQTRARNAAAKARRDARQQKLVATFAPLQPDPPGFLARIVSWVRGAF